MPKPQNTQTQSKTTNVDKNKQIVPVFQGSFKFPKVITLHNYYLILQIIYVIYDKISVDVPYTKVLEFNEKMSQNESYSKDCLTTLDQSNFKRFSDVIKQTQFYHNSVISEYDYNLLVTKIVTWPNEYIIPFLDFFRMFLLHPRAHDYFKKTGAGLSELNSLFERFKNGNDNIKILVLRVINNYFYYEYPRVFIGGRRESVLNTISSVMDSENKNIRSGISSVLYKYISNINFSYSIIFFDKNDKEASIQLISLLNEVR